MEEGGAVVVGEDLKIDAECLAVSEHRAVMIGNSGRAEIGVEMVLRIEADFLAHFPFGQHVATAHGQVAPARPRRRLQDGAAPSGPGHLPRRCQA